MVVITTGRTSDTEYDVKALFSEWAIHRFLYKVSSLKTMQVQLFLGTVYMNPGQLIAPGQLTDPGVNFASVHGLTPVTVHMSFSLHRVTGLAEVTFLHVNRTQSCPGTRIVLRMLIINV